MMDVAAERLKEARLGARYASAEAACAAFGWKPAAYRHHEGGVRGYDVETAVRYGRAFKVSPAWLLGLADDPGEQSAAARQPPTAVAVRPDNDDLETVEIQHLDLAFGLGATFTDSSAPEISLLPFPRPWIDTITRSPAELLTWTRGRGESMRPTIDDGDLILLDRSQRNVREQDAMWAFTIGDVASIKRLRVKGDRFQILSDNPSVPPDEEPIDFVNIVARVVFVGRRV